MIQFLKNNQRQSPARPHAAFKMIVSAISVCFIFILSQSQTIAQEKATASVDRTGANPSTPVKRPGQRSGLKTQNPMADPRRWMFIAIVAFLVIGGGRKWLKSVHGRRISDKIADGTASPEEIRSSFQFGRIVVADLLQVLTEGKTPEIRNSAFESLVQLWKADELISEEEKAIVTRSVQIEWHQRRKYPRALTGSFQISARLGFPDTADQTVNQWLQSHLQFSRRLTGSRRAAYEVWQAVPHHSADVQAELHAGDFPEDQVHRIALFVKVKTDDLTSSWELELPAFPTSFEWDRHLNLNALAGPAIDSEMATIQNAFNWRTNQISNSQENPRIVPISDSFAIRNPPDLYVELPMPRDLSHQAFIEIKGCESLIPAGSWIMATRNKIDPSANSEIKCQNWSIAPDSIVADDKIGHGGKFELRVVLEPSPERGWSDPEIRSVYPNQIKTAWTEIEIVRI